MNLVMELLDALEIIDADIDSEYEETLNLPLDERIAKGATMVDLKVEFEYFDSKPNQWCPNLDDRYKFVKRAKVTCSSNISKFREGSSIILSNGPNKLKMDISEDSISNFTLEPNEYEVKYCYLDTEAYFGDNWEINAQKVDVKGKLLLATLNYLIKNVSKRDELSDLFLGQSINSKMYDEVYTGLNNSQNQAVSKALSSSNYSIIQGPPGTGKTKTIAHIANRLCQEGKKVFITANTHTAINNCLNAISEKVGDASKIVKIGEKHGAVEILNNKRITRKTRLPYYSYTDDDSLSKAGIIIGGTAFCLCYPASKRLDGWTFDVVIIDEAAQLSMPLGLAAMARCDKYILVGDHKQLPPIIPKASENSLLKGSVFKKLVDLYPEEVSLLDTSYRLNKELIRIPNALFYDARLKSSESTSISSMRYDGKYYPDLLNTNDSHVLYLHNEFDSYGRSPHEAKIASKLVKDLVANNVSLKQIAIITPYRSQVREIRRQVYNELGELPMDLFIDTVERMQGQEKDYVIYSMSNSHPLESKQRLDFFYNPNRLNVAITRARIKCIVLSNFKVFDISEDEISNLPDASAVKKGLLVFKEYFNLATKVKEERKSDNVW